MLFWHAGATVAIARYTFRDDRMDLRMLVVGALLPDVIDTPIGLLFFGRLHSVRLVTHGMILAAIVMVAVVMSTRRGRPRKTWMPLAIGLLLHILLDALWLDPETLWWPLMGWSFSPADATTVGGYLADVLSDWRVWLGEVAGLIYLAYLWSAAGLADPEQRALLMRKGQIDVPIDGEATC